MRFRVDLRACLVYERKTCMKVLHMALFQPPRVYYLYWCHRLYPLKACMLSGLYNISDIQPSFAVTPTLKLSRFVTGKLLDAKGFCVDKVKTSQ